MLQEKERPRLDHDTKKQENLNPWRTGSEKKVPAPAAVAPSHSATPAAEATAHTLTPAAQVAHRELFAGMFGGESHAAVQAGPHAKVRDPGAPAMAPLDGPTTLYVQSAGDKHDVGVQDLKQGQLGDCFVLSAIGSLAAQHPDKIKSMIHENDDKNGKLVSYTVTLKQQNPDGTYKDQPITVDPTFPAADRHASPAETNAQGQQEIWPLVMEKAIAQKHGGYDVIDKGGDPGQVMSELTGRDTTYETPGQYQAPALQHDVLAGKGVVFATREVQKNETLPFGLVDSHGYTCTGITKGPDGKEYVTLNNPWGFNQPKPIPYDQIKGNFQEIAVN